MPTNTARWAACIKSGASTRKETTYPRQQARRRPKIVSFMVLHEGLHDETYDRARQPPIVLATDCMIDV
jgi:hypothetical protein